MPLNFATFFVEYDIVRIAGNIDDRHHLAAMGLVVGARLMVLSRLMDNYIVRVGDTKIGLSIQLAKRIIVQEI